MKPILFSTPMVQALLNTKPNTWPPEPIDPSKPCKGMTRRVVKSKHWPVPLADGFEWVFHPTKDGMWEVGAYNPSTGEGSFHSYIKPRYQPGDVLWVREMWCRKWDVDQNKWSDPKQYHYKADGYEVFHVDSALKSPWRPSIHMPKEAARLFLMVKDVRVERLQDITIEDICNEGIETDCRDCISHYGNPSCFEVDDECGLYEDTFTQFEQLWYSLSGKEYPWKSNPWVWVVSFERTENHG